MKATVSQSGTSIFNLKSSFSFAGMMKCAKRSVVNSAANVSLARIFSCLLEQEVTPAQTFAILNLLFAICLAVFPVDMPFVLRMLFVAWLAMAANSVRSLRLFEED